MSKLNVEVELDWFNEEGESYEDHLKDVVDEAIINSIDKKVEKFIEKRINEIYSDDSIVEIKKRIDDRLTSYLDNFFETPFDQRDYYGDVIKSNVTVKSLLKEKCDNYLTAKVDRDGREVKDSWGTTATRLDYLIGKYCDYSMKSSIEKAVKSAVDKIKEEANRIAGNELATRLAKLAGKDTLFEIATDE